MCSCVLYGSGIVGKSREEVFELVGKIADAITEEKSSTKHMHPIDDQNEYFADILKQNNNMLAGGTPEEEALRAKIYFSVGNFCNNIKKERKLSNCATRNKAEFGNLLHKGEISIWEYSVAENNIVKSYKESHGKLEEETRKISEEICESEKAFDYWHDIVVNELQDPDVPDPCAQLTQDGLLAQDGLPYHADFYWVHTKWLKELSTKDFYKKWDELQKYRIIHSANADNGVFWWADYLGKALPFAETERYNRYVEGIAGVGFFGGYCLYRGVQGGGGTSYLSSSQYKTLFANLEKEYKLPKSDVERPEWIIRAAGEREPLMCRSNEQGTDDDCKPKGEAAGGENNSESKTQSD